MPDNSPPAIDPDYAQALGAFTSRLRADGIFTQAEERLDALEALRAQASVAPQPQQNIFPCARCGSLQSSSNLGPIRNMPGAGRYCFNCRANEPLNNCTHCGDAIFRNGAPTDGRYPYCVPCAERRGLSTDSTHARIYRHDYAPANLRFAGFRPVDSSGAPELFCGIELEVESSRHMNRQGMANTVHEILGSESFFSKSDGSLNDGIEIVSHPFTMTKFPFEKLRTLCETLKKAECRSYAPGSCGLHVHVGREGLCGKPLRSPDGVSYTSFSSVLRGSEEERSIWRGVTILRSHLFNLSRRTSSDRTDRYCRFPEPLPDAPLHRPAPCPNSLLTRAQIGIRYEGQHVPPTPLSISAAQTLQLEYDWRPAVSASGMTCVVRQTESARPLTEVRPVTPNCRCLSCSVIIWQNSRARVVLQQMSQAVSQRFARSMSGYLERGHAPTPEEILAAQRSAEQSVSLYRALCNESYFSWPLMTGTTRTEGWRNNRYQAINFMNNQTIEVRFFRGTLHPDSAVNSIKFAVELIRFLCGTSPARLTLIERGKLNPDTLWFELLSSLPAPLRAWTLERSATKTRYKDQARKFKEKVPARVELAYPSLPGANLLALEGAS